MGRHVERRNWGSADSKTSVRPLFEEAVNQGDLSTEDENAAENNPMIRCDNALDEGRHL
jgi:hypothetical protein